MIVFVPLHPQTNHLYPSQWVIWNWYMLEDFWITERHLPSVEYERVTSLVELSQCMWLYNLLLLNKRQVSSAKLMLFDILRSCIFQIHYNKSMVLFGWIGVEGISKSIALKSWITNSLNLESNSLHTQMKPEYWTGFWHGPSEHLL